MRRFTSIAMIGIMAGLAGCNSDRTPEKAKAFAEKAETELLELTNAASRAQWVQETFITGDTQAIAAEANEKQIAAHVRLAK